MAGSVVGIVSDILRLGILFLRSSSATRAENLVLRRQFARYIERGIKPRRVDQANRVSLALFTRLFDWRDAVVNVRVLSNYSADSRGRLAAWARCRRCCRSC